MSATLARYDAACRALAEARSVDEVKGIKDKAEALRAYARQANNPQLEADAWEIRKRAEDKLGELSVALDRAHKSGRGSTVQLPSGGKSKAQALKAAGISTSAANRYEQFNRLPTREKERRIAQGRAAIEAGKSIADTIIAQDAKKERRTAREQALGAKQAARKGERLPKPRDDIGLNSSREAERLRVRIEELQAQVRQRDIKITALESEIEEAKAAPERKLARLAELENKTRTQEITIEGLRRDIADLQKTSGDPMSISEFQTAIRKWEETVETQRGIIARLEHENANLRAGVAAPPDDDLDIPASLRRAPR